MPRAELAHLELLAEVDTLVDRLNRWADNAPAWQPAEKCRALVRRLTERAASLRVRLEAPLIVATLGGTGTGKSALVNALLGAEVVETGRARPTTMRPTLITRPGLTPDVLGIDPQSVQWIERDLPALRDLVLVDCPDPDTTEDESDSDASPVPRPPSPAPQLASNLARLRAILPKCDVLLVTATQQKYRSARVAEELTAAARGARVVFVQTHADTDDDIRDDWRHVLSAELLRGSEGQAVPDTTSHPSLRSSSFGTSSGGSSASAGEPVGSGASESCLPKLELRNEAQALTLALSQGERGLSTIFRVDSLRALADAQGGMQPRGDLRELLDLLTRQMVGAAANRIRRVNFLDLTAETLDACRTRIDEALSHVKDLQEAIDQQRGLLSGKIAGEMQAELLAHRRQWENRLLAQTASRWGFSPFALVLRAYQGLGGLVSGALLYRARTPAQMALWGALEGVRTWRKHRQNVQTDPATAGGFDAAELRKASIIVEGYAAEAGFDRSAAQWATVSVEAQKAADGFVARVAAELQSLIGRLAQRHTGWFTRFRYEILLLVMLGVVLYRLGKNFFYDSWFAPQPVPVFGMEFYVAALFWLLLWCVLLLWAFSRRLRRGLRGEIARLAANWQDGAPAAGIFVRVETECRGVERFSQELSLLRHDVDALQRQVASNVR